MNRWFKNARNVPVADEDVPLMLREDEQQEIESFKSDDELTKAEARAKEIQAKLADAVVVFLDEFDQWAEAPIEAVEARCGKIHEEVNVWQRELSFNRERDGLGSTAFDATIQLQRVRLVLQKTRQHADISKDSLDKEMEGAIGGQQLTAARARRKRELRTHHARRTIVARVQQVRQAEKQTKDTVVVIHREQGGIPTVDVVQPLADSFRQNSSDETVVSHAANRQPSDNQTTRESTINQHEQTIGRHPTRSTEGDTVVESRANNDCKPNEWDKAAEEQMRCDKNNDQRRPDGGIDDDEKEEENPKANASIRDRVSTEGGQTRPISKIDLSQFDDSQGCSIGCGSCFVLGAAMLSCLQTQANRFASSFVVMARALGAWSTAATPENEPVDQDDPNAGNPVSLYNTVLNFVYSAERAIDHNVFGQPTSEPGP